MPDEAIAHFLDSIAWSKRGAASTSRSSDRPRTPSAIARARRLLATPAPTIAVELDELRRFFNYDLELERAFKAIQRKVQAGECRFPRSFTARSSRYLTVPDVTASRFGHSGGRS